MKDWILKNRTRQLGWLGRGLGLKNKRKRTEKKNKKQRKSLIIKFRREAKKGQCCRSQGEVCVRINMFNNPERLSKNRSDRKPAALAICKPEL